MMSLVSGLLGSVVGAAITLFATSRVARQQAINQFKRDTLAGRKEAIELIYRFVNVYIGTDAKSSMSVRELAAQLEGKARFLDETERNAVRDVLGAYCYNPSTPIDHPKILALKDHARNAEDSCTKLERELTT